MFDIHYLNKKLLPELREIAKNLGVPRYQKLKKQELIYEILDVQATQASLPKKSDVEEKKKRSRIKKVVKNKATNPTAEKDQKKDYRQEDRSKEPMKNKKKITTTTMEDPNTMTLNLIVS